MFSNEILDIPQDVSCEQGYNLPAFGFAEDPSTGSGQARRPVTPCEASTGSAVEASGQAPPIKPALARDLQLEPSSAPLDCNLKVACRAAADQETGGPAGRPGFAAPKKRPPMPNEINTHAVLVRAKREKRESLKVCRQQMRGARQRAAAMPARPRRRRASVASARADDDGGDGGGSSGDGDGDGPPAHCRRSQQAMSSLHGEA